MLAPFPIIATARKEQEGIPWTGKPENRKTHICSIGTTSAIIVWLYAYHGHTNNP
jgi:hypothetical protein